EAVEKLAVRELMAPSAARSAAFCMARLVEYQEAASEPKPTAPMMTVNATAKMAMTLPRRLPRKRLARRWSSAKRRAKVSAHPTNAAAPGFPDRLFMALIISLFWP